jgi:Acyl-CoA carboxylase epsilon subunit
MLRVVRGEPTAEELAALTVVLAARAASATVAQRPRSAWADPAAQVRRPLSHGPDAWRRQDQRR